MDRQCEIGRTVEKEILHLYGQSQDASGRAKLARLRNSIGKSDMVETYPFLFEILPESLLGRGRYLSDEERAVVCSLQLYALLQQGRAECAHIRNEKYQNLGTTLSRLRGGESKSIDRRFNSMVLADTGEEFLIQLRYLLKLFKSKDKLGTLDFSQLSSDIYCFIHWEKGKNEIRLNWSREYYRRNEKGEENDD